MRFLIFMLLLLLTACSKPFASQPPLIQAIIKQQPTTVSQLLNKGSNVDMQLQGGVTPLMIAASVGNNEIVSILLQHQAKINLATADGNTALTIAGAAGNSGVAKQLINAGAFPCVKNHKGLDAYTAALAGGSPGAAKNLESIHLKCLHAELR